MYVLKKTSKPHIITYMTYDEKSYKVKVISSNLNRIHVNYINIYCKKIYNNIYKIQFLDEFDKLASIVMRYLYDDSDDEDDGNMVILLGEIEKLRTELELEYKNLLKIEEYKDYLDKLTFLHTELKSKIAYKRYQTSLNEFVRGQSR